MWDVGEKPGCDMLNKFRCELVICKGGALAA